MRKSTAVRTTGWSNCWCTRFRVNARYYDIIVYFVYTRQGDTRHDLQQCRTQYGTRDDRIHNICMYNANMYILYALVRSRWLHNDMHDNNSGTNEMYARVGSLGDARRIIPVVVVVCKSHDTHTSDTCTHAHCHGFVYISRHVRCTFIRVCIRIDDIMYSALQVEAATFLRCNGFCIAVPMPWRWCHCTDKKASAAERCIQRVIITICVCRWLRDVCRLDINTVFEMIEDVYGTTGLGNRESLNLRSQHKCSDTVQCTDLV